jgi:hypothetical protein
MRCCAFNRSALTGFAGLTGSALALRWSCLTGGRSRNTGDGGYSLTVRCTGSSARPQFEARQGAPRNTPLISRPESSQEKTLP